MIDFFTEELSAKITLQSLLPKIVPEGTEYNIYSFNGKFDLLKKLPKRLRAYHHDPLSAHKVVIMIDRDNKDCHELKNDLERYVERANLISKRANPAQFQVVTRIVITELESWFIGDMEALLTAYPSIPTSLQSKSKYRNPDAIDKPSEALLKILKTHTSEYTNITRLIKGDVAKRISENMNPAVNRSPSFQIFCEGVRACCSQRF